jgi:pentatricopeptide repeat protein
VERGALPLERAVALSPKSAKALNNLAVACGRNGDFEEARKTYEKALALQPNDPSIQPNYDLFRGADDKRRDRARQQRQQHAQLPPSSNPRP